MMWRNMKKPSPAGKGDHEVVDEEIIFCADEKAISSSVTRKLVPPSPLEKAIDSRFVKCNFLAFLTNISTAWISALSLCKRRNFRSLLLEEKGDRAAVDEV